jgi:hypothetical protein
MFEFIHVHPLLATLIAFGAGLVFGWRAKAQKLKEETAALELMMKNFREYNAAQGSNNERPPT